MTPSTDFSAYARVFREMGFITTTPTPDTIVCATQESEFFGVKILTGNRFAFRVEDGEFSLYCVCGHPTGDFYALHFRKFEEVSDFVSLLLDSPPNSTQS